MIGPHASKYKLADVGRPEYKECSRHRIMSRIFAIIRYQYETGMVPTPELTRGKMTIEYAAIISLSSPYIFLAMYPRPATIIIQCSISSSLCIITRYPCHATFL